MVELIVRLFRWLFGSRPAAPPPLPPPPAVVPRGVDGSERRARIESTLRRWEEHPLDEPLPYCRADGILSKGEKALWYPLWRAVEGRYRIFCKVRLADVVCGPKQHPEERRWFKKIRGYHVDFVIAHPDTTAPLLVVEHDDRRHRQRPRRRSDDFKDAVLRAAGMPILRVRAQQAYDPNELRETIDRMIGGGATAAAPRA